MTDRILLNRRHRETVEESLLPALAGLPVSDKVARLVNDAASSGTGHSVPAYNKNPDTLAVFHGASITALAEVVALQNRRIAALEDALITERNKRKP